MAFTVDVLFKGLNDLQGEKTSLEQQLNEVRNKRRGLEAGLEQCKERANKTHETNQAMQEAAKKARHKVAQMQVQAKSLEDMNERGRARLKELNLKIESDLKNRQEDVRKFEVELENLANTLKTAKVTYTDDVIEREKETTKQAKENLHHAINQSQQEMDDLMRTISELSMEDKTKKKELVIPAETQHYVLDIVTKEQQAAREVVAGMQEQLTSLRQEMEELVAASPDSGKEIQDETPEELTEAEM